MRILLEGWELARASDLGGVQSYWRQLVPALLDEAPADLQFVLLSAFLHPRRVAAMQAFRQRGAILRHWWADPRWLQALGRRGFRADWFAGPHDLVHAPEPTWSLPSSGRLVLTLHDLMFVHHPQYLAPHWAARLLAGMERAVPRACFWICDSEATRADLLCHYRVPPGRTTVVPLGVDERFRALGDEREDRGRAAPEGARFLFLGSVEPKKNLPRLLDAFALAAQRGLRAGLDVAGRAGWGSAALRELADSPPLRERVRFLGFVPDAELPGRVADALALVLPSRYEGFGMPVLEAMAAGTPVLCSDRGALPEVASDAALLVDPDDVEGMATRLLEIEGDAALRARLSEAGRRRAAAFSWGRCARETLAAYRRAMELSR